MTLIDEYINRCQGVYMSKDDMSGLSSPLSSNQQDFVQQVLKLGLEVDSYSGRGMFGAKCPAVYVRRVGEMRLDCAYRQDVMGLGFVLYADC